MNSVLLLGRLTADPELKQTNSGKSVCSFTLAVDKKGKDAGADFFDCVAWEKRAEFLAKWFSKGKPVIVAGRLATRSWEDKNGGKRKSVEVIADAIEFVPGEKRDPEDVNRETYSPQAVAGNERADGFIDIVDDDLPFD